MYHSNFPFHSNQTREERKRVSCTWHRPQLIQSDSCTLPYTCLPWLVDLVWLSRLVNLIPPLSLSGIHEDAMNIEEDARGGEHKNKLQTNFDYGNRHANDNAVCWIVSLLGPKIAPPDIVSCSKVVGADWASAPVRVVLRDDLLLLQLLQHGCEERPSSIELVTPNEESPLAFNGVEQKPLVSIRNLFLVSAKKNGWSGSCFQMGLTHWMFLTLECYNKKRLPCSVEKVQVTPIQSHSQPRNLVIDLQVNGFIRLHSNY